ncbi:MAG TPA: mechanosensitive ion channel domain-containing protein [Verrucomicrobiae bacterium]|jgi:small conductance mechanosensitive channel|nr:mechanosensitive ion channel domain-containing protein [Verrucomicrobiae bacterium]
MASPTNIINSALQGGANAVTDPLATAQRFWIWWEGHQWEIIDAAAILLAGMVASGWIGRIASRAMERRNLEPPVRYLLVRVIRVGLLGLALVIALDNLGFKVTALFAGAGVVGVGLGFGMQSMVSNMIAGVTLIFTKPFRVGEYVEILGVRGVVTNINLMSTFLQRGDLSRVVIPNQKIIGEVLHNFGFSRQLDLSIGVGYQTDLAKAQTLALEVARANKRVLPSPPAGVSIGSLGDSAIVIKVNAWVKLDDFGPAQTEIYQAIVERYRQQQIEIPFPQREVRLLQPVGA